MQAPGAASVESAWRPQAWDLCDQNRMQKELAQAYGTHIGLVVEKERGRDRETESEKRARARGRQNREDMEKRRGGA